MVDYVLSRDVVRIQAHTDVKNTGSQKVLEKTGFQKEGIVRKCLFNRGEWTNYISTASSEKNGKNQKY